MSQAPLRLSPSAGLRERRLIELLRGRSEQDPALSGIVRDAQVMGSLELAGFAFGWEEVRAAGRGEAAATPIVRLQGATQAVDAEAPLDRRALLLWHGCLTGGAGAFRATEATREDGPAPSPAAFIESRLSLLEDWLASDSARTLAPAQLGALVLARTLEVRPFQEANGRVARLAASHAVVRAGGRRPILVGGDRERLAACVQAAFHLETEPLTTLLQEASARAVDVMIQAIETHGAEDTALRDR